MKFQPPGVGARGSATTIARAWALILGVALVFGLAALAYSWTVEPVYRATATLYVTSSSTSSSYDAVRASKERAATYAQLVYTDAVLAPAVTAAGIDMPLGAARDAVQVEVNSQVMTMTVSATDHNPLTAQRLANAVSDSLADAVSTLDVPSGGGTPAARLTVVNTAAVDPSPVSPRTMLNVIIGTVVGLVAGLALALLRERFNNRLRDEHDAESALDARALMSMHCKDLPDTVINFDSDVTENADIFRRLRTQVLAATQGTDIRRLLVTSARPGEGKTAVAVNLAAALAHADYSVVIVDANLSDAQVSSRTGVDRGKGLIDAVSGQVPIDAVLQSSPHSKMSVLGAGTVVPSNAADLVSTKAFGQLLAELAARFDYVIMDSSSLLEGLEAPAAAASADGVLVVSRRKTRLSDLRQVRNLLADVNSRVVGVVLCNLPRAGRRKSSGRRRRSHGTGGRPVGELVEHETPDEQTTEIRKAPQA